MGTSSFQFSLENGLACSLSYVKARDGLLLQREDLRRLPKAFLDRLLACASRAFSQNNPSSFLQRTGSSRDIHFSLGRGVEASGRNLGEASPLWDAYIQEVDGVDRYAKRCGIGPYALKQPASAHGPFFRREEERYLSTQEKPKFDPLFHINAVIGLGSDGIILTRNIFRSIESIGPDHSSVYQLGCSLLPLFGVSSAFMFHSSYEGYQEAAKINDPEGKRESLRKAVEAVLLSLGTLTWTGANIADAVSSMQAGAEMLGNICSLLFIANSLVGLASSSISFARCFHLRERIDSFLLNENLTEAQKVRGTLQFFRDQLFPTEREKEELLQREAPENRERAFLTLVQKKVACFKRRAGNKSVREILKNLDKILSGLADRSSQNEAVQAGMALIQLVKTENKKRIFFHALTLLASVIGLVASILMLSSGFGAIPFILGAIAAAIWVGLGSYGAYVYFRGHGSLESQGAGSSVIPSYQF